jgi:acyl carrier protein
MQPFDQERVEAIIRRFARKDKRNVPLSRETALFDELQVNSASRVDIVLELEDTFGISITDDEADTLATVGQVLDMIASKTASAVSEAPSQQPVPDHT